MRTIKQIEAARANGAKSHGPVTEMGKAISARNNTRHGLLSQAVVLVGELPENFTALVATLVAEHQPQTESEMEQVEKMAVAYWRQLRTLSAEKATHDADMMRQQSGDGPTRFARSMDNNDSRIKSIHRYETSYERQYSRALRQLEFLKAHRRPNLDDSSSNEITNAGITWAPGPFPGKSDPSE